MPCKEYCIEFQFPYGVLTVLMKRRVAGQLCHSGRYLSITLQSAHLSVEQLRNIKCKIILQCSVNFTQLNLLMRQRLLLNQKYDILSKKNREFEEKNYYDLHRSL